jgi:trans-aconitate methyltransferase
MPASKSSFCASKSASSVPPNCLFQVDDAEDDWTFNEPFDYIHARAVVTCFKDNRAMLQKIYDNLAPGGYFELQDPCLPMQSDDGTLEGTPLGE